MKREYKDYIVDILDAIEKIARFTKNMDLQHFKSDDKTVFADQFFVFFVYCSDFTLNNNLPEWRNW